MPIAQPDGTKGTIAEYLERCIRARRTRLRGANQEVISLDRDTGYAEDDDGLLWRLWSSIPLWWVWLWWLWWWDGRESGWKWNWMRDWKLLMRVVVIVDIVYVR